jgi:hypothetical protein
MLPGGRQRPPRGNRKRCPPPAVQALEPRNLLSGATLGPLVQVSGPSPFAADAPGDPYLNNATEARLAVNPANSNNIVGVWQQDDFLGLVAGVSFDGGRSWRRVVIPGVSQDSGSPLPLAAAADPWVAFAPNGELYASSATFDNTAGSFTAIMVARSDDGGLTWAPPATLVNQPASNFVPLDDRDAVATDPGNAHLAYAAWASEGLTSQVVFTRSTDGGTTWEPGRVLFDAGPNAGFLGNTIRTLPNGTVLDFFDNNQLGPGNPSQTLELLRSPDQGRTWVPGGHPIQVAAMPPALVLDPNTGTPVRAGAGLPGVPHDFFDVAVDPNNGHLYAVWTDASFSNGQYDSIAFSMSANGGLTWSRPIKINQTPDNIPPGDQQAFTPSVAVAADGTVAVTYYDFRNNAGGPGLPTDYWMVYANPHSRGGLTNPANWTQELRLTDASFNMENAYFSFDFGPGAYFLGDYQSLIASGNDFVAMFGATLSQPYTSNIFARRIHFQEDDASPSFARGARAGAGVPTQQHAVTPHAAAAASHGAHAAALSHGNVDLLFALLSDPAVCNRLTGHRTG